MAPIELSLLSAAILEATAGKVLAGARRREAVIRLLKKVRLDPDRPPEDFDGLYAYTLVEYGIDKPSPILNFFRNQFVRDAFRQSFSTGDPSILEREAQEVIAWTEETGKLGRIDYDPRREFASFTAVFNQLVDRLRDPVETRRDQRLESMHTSLHEDIHQILISLERLDQLRDIRAEVSRLAKAQETRRFVIAPAGDRLKVFISSRMNELRDAREIVGKALQDRDIDAWIYEADASAQPDSVSATSLDAVQAADIYVGLFWKSLGDLTAEEFHRARELAKPCFVYIRDQHLTRDPTLQHFLERYVTDAGRGVTYSYFDKVLLLAHQVADDILSWLVRTHREMTAQLSEASISKEEIEGLQQKATRLQAITENPLPNGTVADYLAQQVRPWFEALGYGFERHEVRNDLFFEWILNVQTRRGYDRILVRGVDGEVALNHVGDLRDAVTTTHANEGWVIAARRISAAARHEVTKPENRDLLCFTLDELIDQDADFTGYFEWLDKEVHRHNIDSQYVPLYGSKEEVDPLSGALLGTSRYDKENGGLDGYIDRWLADPSKEHISILGEFGMGKTWFTLHYAWKLLREYRSAMERGVERPRLPLVIPLQDYAKAVTVESLFSEFFFRKHEINLPGYTAFEQLNRMGKLLLILDGFDEMAARIDRQQMINNFWELARMVAPGSKLILTCRTEHFPEAKEGRSLLRAELQASTSSLTGEPPQFEVLEINAMEDEQIRQVLTYHATGAVVDMIMNNDALLDLVRRPLMVELILDALPDIEAGKAVDLARVYLYAIRRKMERDIKNERTFTSLADKLYFLCELSWEMLSGDRMSLNYRAFPERIQRYFGHTVQEERTLDYWHFDMMSQTMLIRNAAGDYSPAHRSLVEFFVAYKFGAELGILARDFTDVAKSQSSLAASEEQDYTWSGYFQRQIDESRELRVIAPLRSFVPETTAKLAGTVGAEPLTAVVEGLLGDMAISDNRALKARLLNILADTRGRTSDEVGALGRNVVGILVARDPGALKGADLRGTNLRGAGLGYLDLSGTNMAGAELSRCDFAGSDLREASLSRAHVPESRGLPESRLAISALDISLDGRALLGCGLDGRGRIWSLVDGSLEADWDLGIGPITAACFSPDASSIGVGSVFGEVRLIRALDREIIREDALGGPVRALEFSTDGEKLVVGGPAGAGGYLVCNFLGGNVFREWTRTDTSVEDIGFCEARNTFIVICQDGVYSWNVSGGRRGSRTRRGEAVSRLGKLPASPAGGFLTVTRQCMVMTAVGFGDLRASVVDPWRNMVVLETAKIADWDGAAALALEFVWEGRERFTTPPTAMLRRRTAAITSQDVIAYGSPDSSGAVVVWDHVSNVPLWRRTLHAAAISVLTLSPDEAIVATAGEDGRIVVSNLADGSEVRVFAVGNMYRGLRIGGTRGLRDVQRRALRELGAGPE